MEIRVSPIMDANGRRWTLVDLFFSVSPSAWLTRDTQFWFQAEVLSLCSTKVWIYRNPTPVLLCIINYLQH